MKRDVRFTSVLPVSRRDELERLLFFNENQHKVEASLLDALRRYGAPRMTFDDGCIRFVVPKLPAVQTLYALDDADVPPTLAAVAIYTREDFETLAVLFFAIHERYAGGALHEGEMLSARLMDLLRASAARTRGVRWLRLPYRQDVRFPVRPGDPG